MSWIQRTFGLDGVDLVIHAGVTFAVMAVGSSFLHHEGAEVMLASVSGVSLALLGVRRRLALRRHGQNRTGEVVAERIAELEARLMDSEQMDGRILELEERLDFTERLLATHREQVQLPPVAGTSPR